MPLTRNDELPFDKLDFKLNDSSNELLISNFYFMKILVDSYVMLLVLSSASLYMMSLVHLVTHKECSCSF